MTIEEVKKLLKSLSSAKSLVYMKKRQLNFYLKHLDMLKAVDYSKTKICTSEMISCVEMAVMKIETYQEQYTQAMNRMFAIEDKISECVQCLTADEKKLIIERFMDDTPLFQLSKTHHYTRDSLNNKFYKIYKKIAKYNVNNKFNVKKLL